jgi:hypothetical protein
LSGTASSSGMVSLPVVFISMTVFRRGRKSSGLLPLSAVFLQPQMLWLVLLISLMFGWPSPCFMSSLPNFLESVLLGVLLPWGFC